MKQAVSIVGSGRMGAALARAYLGEHHPTSVWNRTRARAEPLQRSGALVAERVEEVIEAATVVFACVLDYQAAAEWLHAHSVARALRGKLLVQLTSGSPREARAWAAWAESHGIGYLDAAIMATPNFIGQAGCTILYAGDQAIFERHRPLLEVLGGNAQYLGADAGRASAMDSALLAAMWGALFGAVQGAVISEAEGLPFALYRRHHASVKAMLDGAVEDTLSRAAEGRYAADEHTLATLAAHHGAFRHLHEIGRDRGLDPSLLDAFARLFEKAHERGHEDDDFAVMHALLGRG
jgi:3-hydroxyisobutyrate dehydrogenase-like beta-hydroxyacid dehydrogenase